MAFSRQKILVGQVFITLFIMDYHIHIDTISMELSILYFKGLLVLISLKRCISVTEDCFILANTADPDEMLPYAAFHQGLHCLLIAAYRYVT